MIESGGGAGFALEAFERLRIGGELVGKEFQSYQAAERGVFGLVHDPHSAATEFFEDAVMRNGLVQRRPGLAHRAVMLRRAEPQVNGGSLRKNEAISIYRIRIWLRGEWGCRDLRLSKV